MSDIHVAPCYCELHTRIRELEWDMGVMKARAERAEVRVAELVAEIEWFHRTETNPMNENISDIECFYEEWNSKSCAVKLRPTEMQR